MPFPWPPAAATGLGPMSGDDALAVARLSLDALPDFPFAPWLPGGGVGSDFAGRGCALLVDLHVDLQPAGWRLVPRPGRDEQRARDARARELDAIEEAAEDYRGPMKVSVPGPWSLAASIDLARGERALADPGAVRDLAASLAEGVRRHADEVVRRIPGVSAVVQLDEPLLPAILAGAIPTSSGWGRHPSVDDPVARDVLSAVLDAAGDAPGVRCAGTAPPVGLVVRAGARWVGIDAPAVDTVPEDDLGDALEGAGAGLLLGLVPPDGASPADARDLAEPAVRLWRRLGLAPSALPDTVVVTPTDGLERLSPFRAGEVLRRCRDVADALAEQSVA